MPPSIPASRIGILTEIVRTLNDIKRPHSAPCYCVNALAFNANACGHRKLRLPVLTRKSRTSKFVRAVSGIMAGSVNGTALAEPHEGFVVGAGADSTSKEVPYPTLPNPRTYMPWRICPNALGGVRHAQDTGDGRIPFWSYKLYRGPQGQAVKITYCQTLKESEEAAKRLLDEEVLGFDMEWEGQSTTKSPLSDRISLIQLACDHEVVLFHVALHKGNKISDKLAPSLQKILTSDNIIKTGVAVENADGKRLKSVYNVSAKGLIELSHLHNLVTYYNTDRSMCNKRLRALAMQTETHLGGLPLSKNSKIRAGHWSNALNAEQKDYAASDAYAGLMLYHILEEKRSKLGPPVPARPPFAELYAPLFYGAEKFGISDKATDSASKTSSRPTSPTKQPGTKEAPKPTFVPPPELEKVPIYSEGVKYNVLVPKTSISTPNLHAAATFGAASPSVQARALTTLHGPAIKRSRTTCSTTSIVSPATSSDSIESSTSPACAFSTANHNVDNNAVLPPLQSCQPLTSQSQRLFNALKALRIRLARSFLQPGIQRQTSTLIAPMQASCIATDNVLKILAAKHPTSQKELDSIPGAKYFVSLATNQGVDFLAFVRKHYPAEPQQEIALVRSANNSFESTDSADESPPWFDAPEPDQRATMSFDKGDGMDDLPSSIEVLDLTDK